MTAQGPYGPGETAMTHRIAHEVFAQQFARMAALFEEHPRLQATSVCIRNGHVEVLADGSAGVVKEWCHALPTHRETAGLATTAYGAAESVVLTQEEIVVTIRPPFGGVRS